MDDGIDWLTVEAPPHAIAGEVLPLRVRVAGLPAASYLCADLHWSSAHDQTKGYLASGGAQPVGKEGGTFDFAIVVRPADGLRFVNGILFLSPTGEWSNHTFVVATESIPVTDGSVGKASPLVSLQVQQLREAGGSKSVRTSAVPRLMTGLLLLAAAVAAWKTSRSISSGRETSRREHRGWQAWVMVLAVAGLWEVFGLEDWLGLQARAWAHAEDVYYARGWLQKGIISVTLAATVLFLGFVWRQRKPYWLSYFFFGLYLAISIVNLLSLHSIDAYAGLSWRGITLIEAVKFACAAATLKCVWQARAALPS